MKLAVCSRSVSNNLQAINLLKKKFKQIKLNKSNRVLKGKSLYNFVKDHEAIIVGLEKIDRKFLNNCQNLKFIGKYGVGTNNINFEELKKKKIKISLQHGINKRSVSEITLCFILVSLRKIFFTINQVKNNNWPFFAGREMTKKTLGIIGMGNIGRDLVKLIKPFKCNLLCYDIKPDYEYLKKNNLKNSKLSTVLKKSDIVTIHIPYNRKNLKLFSKKKLSQLKKNVTLINTSRGGIVDEQALFSFLNKNKQATAVFDVLNTEPPKKNKLIKLNNFLITSHIAGTTQETLKVASLDCAKKLIDCINK